MHILGIDGASRLGWAYGPAGEPPRSSSFQCAAQEASRGAIFSGAGRWLTAFMAKYPVDLLAIEAPLPGTQVSGKTNVATTTILFGLPAVLEFMAYQHRCYRHERVLLTSVRKHFIGRGNMPGDEAKQAVWRKCMALGWIRSTDDDLSNDRTDALAVWSYAETTFAPKMAQPVDDLFVKAQRRKADAMHASAAPPPPSTQPESF